MDCPYCRCDSLEPVRNTDGVYECQRCGKRTHEKVEANRKKLEELAETDNPASDIARLLVDPDE